ncbi:murein hydrolase activator EnvC family protein [Maricaulis salignorans]|uniref:Septal ring factor EnvC, activator of murein hydrolases AmiA and AmiB n=1 Tax=Maricaulis salignorans TaxID=144026 RepID=A0A1G9LLY0_9PROT|nr:peptidoglycan DD-metalloendopeptidase family protein [Maricaulis salignorans]SDL62980.1 Septal ring factor EnvC, activator of murein hydrolases AmiA and AmiB [Maricaulis salignorans]
MYLLLLSLLLSQAQPAGAPPADAATAEQLEREARETAARAEAAREQADQVASEIALMQRQLVELGQRVGNSEQAALAASGELTRLGSEEAEILARLAAERESLIDILAAIQRIETQTPPAILAAPDDAARAARAAALMAQVAPALQERADALSRELAQLRSIRSDIETQSSVLASAEDVLSAQRLELQALIAERRALEARRRDEAVAFLEASSSAGERARSIRSLLSELTQMAAVMPTLNPRRIELPDTIPEPHMRPARDLIAARAPAEPLETLRFADARGRLRPPAAGEVVRRFAELAEDGTASEGIFIRTRSEAQVVSPFDARIEFAGPFSTYGGLLILNVGEGYYMVLSGMAVTYASAGQSVLAGEPVGAMPDTGQTAPELYLELRRDGNAMDPGPWLRPTAQSG